MTERKVRLKSGSMLSEHMKNKASPGIVIPLVKNYLMAHHGPDTDRQWNVIHPSEMAKSGWCHRATYFRIISGKPPEVEKFNFVQDNIFAVGNDIHAKWQRWLADTGKLWGNWHCTYCNSYVAGERRDNLPSLCPAVPGRVHTWEYREIALGGREPECHYITGHADGAVDDTLVEFKSIGLGTLRIDAPDLLSRYQTGRNTDLNGLWRGIEKPLKTHLRQGDIYLWLAGLDELPFKQMAYVYEFKANQQVKEFIVQFDQSRIQSLLDKAEEIVYAIESDSAPPECSHGGCDQCAGLGKKRRVVK